MITKWIIFQLPWVIANAANIELLECNPPDMPIWGGYGPVEKSYTPGDTIHYYCAIDTFIGGNYFRKCEDSGEWSGDTPVCDGPSTFSTTLQTSSADDTSGPELAVDGIKDTCSATLGGQGDEWSGTFSTPGQLIRVMLFLPKGQTSYEVVLVKLNGEEVICGSQSRNIDRYDWIFHNCPEPNNQASRMMIRSLSTEPLRICEIRAFVLTSPKCTDPHFRVESGHLRINRKSAVLACDRGFTRTPDTKLECIRDGVWNRKSLFCNQPPWEFSQPNDASNTNEPRAHDPDIEREKLREPSILINVSQAINPSRENERIRGQLVQRNAPRTRNSSREQERFKEQLSREP